MAQRNQHFGTRSRTIFRSVVLAVPLVLSVGCYAIRNGWLDPSVLGNFTETATLEIRTSLTLEDSPLDIPGAAYPLPEDLLVEPIEYPIQSGDTLAIEIHELRQVDIPYQAQAVVSSAGYVNLPVVGRVDATGLILPEFEDALAEVLKERNILVDPQVTVNPVFLQNATYSIFGVGVSASNNAPLRAGTFPILRPNLRVLEAINQVGGLNEFVTDVYVFRSDIPSWLRERLSPPVDEEAPTEPIPPDFAPTSPKGVDRGVNQETVEKPAKTSLRSAEEELIAAVEAADEASKAKPPPEEVPKVLEPAPTDPYLWVNGQFVPNPAYKARLRDPASSPPPASLDTVTPAVNWARVAGDTSYRVIRIHADLLRSGDPEANIVIRGGDVIRIVSGQIGVYYVMGQVNRVGAFAFNAEPITLKAAIAGAGGLSSLAWPDRCTVYRRLGQREQMIQVDLDRIFAGKDPDFYIKRGDIINVGTHPFAPFLQALRGLTIPNPVSNIGYSFTYARNFADIDSFIRRRNPADEADAFEALLLDFLSTGGGF